MKFPIIKIILGCLLVCSAGAGYTADANNCRERDPSLMLANLMEQHSNSKVLKVEEMTDDQGCMMLKVRILINGTVKAILITSNNGA